jgi:HSP20 family molecular chaperone IbpA
MTAHWIVPRRASRLNAPTLLGSLWNLDRFFDDLPLLDRPAFETGDLSFAPAVNVEETEDELRLSAELAGLEEEDFEVTTS